MSKANAQKVETLPTDGHFEPAPEFEFPEAEKARAEIVRQAQPGPLVAVSAGARLVELAINEKFDVDRLQKVMELAERWEAREAKKAYDDAMNAFKENPPEIKKNKLVSYKTDKGTTSYRHATLDNVCEQIISALSKHEISHRWKVSQDAAIIRVTCVLTHKLGHFEETTMAAGPDTSGGKNAIQAIGSTVSYLERYTLLAATGLATEDQDDDGRGASPAPTMDKDRLKDHLSAIGMCSNLEILRTTYNTAYTEAKTLKDKDALMQIIDAMDVRKKKLLETEAA